MTTKEVSRFLGKSPIDETLEKPLEGLKGLEREKVRKRLEEIEKELWNITETSKDKRIQEALLAIIGITMRARRFLEKEG